MWELYPNDNQYDLRIAMIKSFDFLTGRYDQEEIERKNITRQINKKLIEDGFDIKQENN